MRTIYVMAVDIMDGRLLAADRQNRDRDRKHLHCTAVVTKRTNDLRHSRISKISKRVNFAGLLRRSGRHMARNSLQAAAKTQCPLNREREHASYGVLQIGPSLVDSCGLATPNRQ